MKVTYVSITEFKENGGKLKKGRNVYTRNEKLNVFECVGVYNGPSKVHDAVSVVKSGNKGWICIDTILHVEIEVTPIYK